jgi:hypothetical protein
VERYTSLATAYKKKEVNETIFQGYMEKLPQCILKRGHKRKASSNALPGEPQAKHPRLSPPVCV